MDLQAKAETSAALGLYVHVPFCAHTCDFCGFYQEAPDRAGLQEYLDTVEQEVAASPPPRPVQTVFFGGGTPGLLMPKDLLRLGKALAPYLDPAGVEWTVEMAPSTVKADKVAALLEMGANRISMGVQSFQPRLLEALGRRHDLRQIYRAIDTLRAGGIRNLNLDLIFAIPGQSANDWEADLKELIAVGPEHVSTYCLTFEEDTALWLRLQKGEVKRLSEEAEIAFFETSWRLLAQAGYGQYEISNYARPGFACRHNCDTWRMQEWIGYGPSASSQIGGRRFTNTPDLRRWREGILVGKPARIDVVALTAATLAADALIFGLRMNAGISRAQLAQRFPAAPWEAFDSLADSLAAEGLLEPDAGRWRLTPAGRLMADAVGEAFLAESLEAEKEEALA